MDLAIAGLAFGTVFLVELPDKTFLATLVLSTRYRPLMVWIGVGLAFLVQTVVAVAAGSAATLLHEDVRHLIVLAVAILGAIVLARGAMSEPDDDDELELKPASGLRAILASFLVLIAAELGDLSQLLTVSLVARFDHPISVFIGAWGALLTVSGIAVLVGAKLKDKIPIRLLQGIGAIGCSILAVVTILTLLP